MMRQRLSEKLSGSSADALREKLSASWNTIKQKMDEDSDEELDEHFSFPKSENARESTEFNAEDLEEIIRRERQIEEMERQDRELKQLQLQAENFRNEAQRISDSLSITGKATQEQNVIWEKAEITLKKGEIEKKVVHLGFPGVYHLSCTKLDKVASRSVKIEVSMCRDGEVVRKAEGGIGGLKWSKTHQMDFKIHNPATFHITFICNNMTPLGSVKFSASLSQSPLDSSTYLASPSADSINTPQIINISESTEHQTHENSSESENEDENEEFKPQTKSIQNPEEITDNAHDDGKVAVLVWEMPHKEMDKNEICTEEIPIDKVGVYQLIFNKTDSIVLRTLSIRIKVTRDGKLTSEGRGGIGGLKWTKSHCMEFVVSRVPSQLTISLKCTNITPIGRIAFKASLFRCKESRGKPLIDTDELGFAEESIANSVTPVTEVMNEDTKRKTLDSCVAANLNKSKVIHHELPAGHYYIGVRNDDTRMGAEYRTLKIDFMVSADDSTQIVHDVVEELRFGDYPWRQTFCVKPEQAPATLTLQLHEASKLSVRYSMKLVEVPDPDSFEEVLKRTKMLQFKIFWFIGFLLFLSYGSQIVSFIFSLSVGSISVRGILTVLTIAFCYHHREEMLTIVKENGEVIKDKLGFFKKLDELETGVQKLKYLQERSKMKQLKRRAKKQLDMRL